VLLALVLPFLVAADPVVAAEAAPAAAPEADAKVESDAEVPKPPTEAKAAPSEKDTVVMPMMTIIGKKEDLAHIAGSAHIVDEEKLELTERDDIHRILQEVPGVYVREEDGFGLRPNIGIRGASSDRSAKVTLMEDGILFAPAPYSAPAAYYFPLTTRMVAVEVYKGPASIQYGPHTIGGAVNLVTRAIPNLPEAGADVAVGQRQTLKAHGWAGQRWGNLGLLLEGIRLESDGFKDLDGGGDTGFTRNEIMLKGDYHWPIEGEIDLVSGLKVGYSDEISNETYLGISDDDFRRTPYRRYAASQPDRMDWDRWQFQLSQHLTVSPDLSFQLTTYRHQLERTWRKLNRFEEGAPELRDIFANPTGRNAVFLSVLRGDSDSTTPLETLLVGTNARKFVSQGIQVVGNWYRPTGPLEHSLELGARLHYDHADRDQTEDPYQMLNATMVPSTDPTRQLADNKGETLAFSLHLRDDIDWGAFTVTPGFRFESIHTDYRDRLPKLSGQPADTESDTQNVLIPGIGALYFVTDELSVLAGVHRGFSPVAPGQSDDADFEESVNYEAGLRYLGAPVRGEMIGFFNDYQNLLATCRQGSGCDPEDVDKQFNAGKVFVYGLELLAETEQQLPWEMRMPISLAYTLTQSSFRESFTSANALLGDVDKGDELPYVPEHQMSFSLGLHRGPLGTTTTLSYVGEMRDVAGDGKIPTAERVEDHFVADLLAYWDFSERGRLYLGLDNLGDADYIVSRRPFGARPGKPFQAMGGIKYHFGG